MVWPSGTEVISVCRCAKGLVARRSVDIAWKCRESCGYVGVVSSRSWC